jgi:hypothetical protein
MNSSLVIVRLQRPRGSNVRNCVLGTRMTHTEAPAKRCTMLDISSPFEINQLLALYQGVPVANYEKEKRPHQWNG